MAGAQIYEDPETIMSKVREGLTKLEKRKTATTKSLVQSMAGDLRKAMNEGSTLADVLKVLNESGMEIKASTLRLYLSQAPEAQPKTPKGTRARTPSNPSEEVTPAAAPRASSGKKAKEDAAKPATSTPGGFDVPEDPEKI